MAPLGLLCIASCLATVLVAQEQTGLLDRGRNLIRQAVSKLVTKIETKINSTEKYANVPKNNFDVVPYKKFCISDTEKIDVCSPKGKTLELVVCLSNAKLPNGYYATNYTRLVNFPTDSFSVVPDVTLQIKNWGNMILGGVQVRADSVSATGFSLVVTGGQPVPPYDLKVKWYACITEEPPAPNSDYTEASTVSDVTST